ncbi:MAG TPA: hypothetical protein VD968_09180 [Pyrinomonadaceae bacterium]|nr:hypothetical protein [Pyrinomonadaceae bacterium]
MTRRKPSALLTAALLLLIPSATLAQHTPAPGSPERKAIADALRAPVEKELKKKVVFKIDALKVQDGWAFLRGVPQQPGGKKMDYSGTKYAREIADDMFDDWICALLRKEGGRWRVVTHVIGATDVVYATWPEDYNAPRAIFDMPEPEQ